jgi:E-phenylitaconyl-CoA hydratase
MNYDTLRYEKHGRVAVLTLNRPERHNAFNMTMIAELADAWRAIKSDAGVVSVVVTGAGEKSFCAGMDLSEVAAGDSDAAARLRREDSPFFRLTALHHRCWKPVITAVNGTVVGGGLHFIIDSDLVIAADNATIRDTHVRAGLIAGIEPVTLARRIPLEQVFRLALMGGAEPMSAQQALHYGLVGEVLPQAQLLPRALQLAEIISRFSPAALARTKQVIWESLDRGLDSALTHTWNTILDYNGHPDIREGAQAFMEKREPRWQPLEEV